MCCTSIVCFRRAVSIPCVRVLAPENEQTCVAGTKRDESSSLLPRSSTHGMDAICLRSWAMLFLACQISLGLCNDRGSIPSKMNGPVDHDDIIEE